MAVQVFCPAAAAVGEVLARGDLLVDLSPEHSLLGVISLRQDLEALLGCSVDVTEEWMSQKRHPASPDPLRNPGPGDGVMSKAGLDLLQQHSTSRGRDHAALLRQKLSRQQSQERLSGPQP
jgi:hypothetical protein